MTNKNLQDKENFLCPRSKYYGRFTVNNLAFNANLQEFSQRVGYISNLQTAGKISPQTAYKQIQGLWKQLKHSKKQLNIKDDK